MFLVPVDLSRDFSLYCKNNHLSEADVVRDCLVLVALGDKAFLDTLNSLAEKASEVFDFGSG